MAECDGQDDEAAAQSRPRLRPVRPAGASHGRGTRTAPPVTAHAIDLAVRRTDDEERRLKFGPADRERLPEVRCERRLDLRHDCGDRRGHCRWKLRERMHESVLRWAGEAQQGAERRTLVRTARAATAAAAPRRRQAACRVAASAAKRGHRSCTFDSGVGQGYGSLKSRCKSETQPEEVNEQARRDGPVKDFVHLLDEIVPECLALLLHLLLGHERTE